MEIIDKKFGKLKVVALVGKDNHRNLLWLCRCDCGGTTVQRTNTLNMGLVKSCGCLIREVNRNRMLSELNPMWAGEKVSLIALHEWLTKRKSKPSQCECCRQSKPYELANISGEYKRDISDYEWLCRKCHMTKDGRINRRKKNGQFERVGVYSPRTHKSLQ